MIVASNPAPRPDRPLLVFEASSGEGSVAIVHDGQTVALIEVAMGAGRDDQLFPSAQALLQNAQLRIAQLGGIVCGAGPGSFTSLRIAAALAKGFAHGANRPLYAVSSLLLAAADAVGLVPPGRYLVHSDALRGERYVQLVLIDARGQVTPNGPATRVEIAALSELAVTEGAIEVLSVGVVAPSVLSHGLIEVGGAAPPTRRVTPRAGKLWHVNAESWCSPVPLGLWEPTYGRLAEAQVKWETAHCATLESATEL